MTGVEGNVLVLDSPDSLVFSPRNGTAPVLPTADCGLAVPISPPAFTHPAWGVLLRTEIASASVLQIFSVDGIQD
jgi:hypothetical protein